MWIEGRIFKAGKECGLVAECEALAIITQGKDYNDAMAMLKDAVELMALHEKRVLFLEIRRGEGENVYIGSKDTKAFFGLLIRRQRQIAQVTIKQAAANMGSAFVNAYAAYEQGKREPTLHLVAQLLKAANPNAEKPLAIIFGDDFGGKRARSKGRKVSAGRHALV
ncbi:MAG: helix-turn-helix transcriptional regulator [Nitrospinae bacterium]|nr:helix-turn-helix transcriptional regulator [Nitrospinota bacterium]